MSACIHHGTSVSECAVYTDTQSYQIQLSYASYYIPVYHDKMITNTEKYILISLSTSLFVIYDIHWGEPEQPLH